ncbi:MAG: DUF3592 domain-containing protein [Ruminococcus sp.]|nr:DUF3592 domain-containing protein [Ruminococcus sp.]
MTGFFLTLAEDSDPYKDSPFAGALTGAQTGIGIVLTVVGVLIIYFAVKMFRGYSFFPEKTAAVVKKDTRIITEAVVTGKHKTVIPDNGSGRRTFMEAEITYTVEGESYKQLIADDGYEEGDKVRIGYEPEDPSEFYVADGGDGAETQTDEEMPETNSKAPIAIMIGVLGLILIAVGIFLVL